MKKTSKIFGTVALSAVLAMGTAMPAFAINNEGADSGTVTNETTYNTEELQAGGASTNVNIATYSSNYSVTVPLFAPFMLDTAGGTGMAPTNYGITNNSDAAVYVTDITWTMNETGSWTFGTSLGTDASPMAIEKNGFFFKKSGSTVTAETTKDTEPEYGSFVITLTPDTYDSTNPDPTGINAPVSTFNGTFEAPQAASVTTSGSVFPNASSNTAKVKWIIDKGDNPITLSIMGSQLKKGLDNIQTEVAAIVYTVDSRAPKDPATVTPAP